MGEVDTSFFEGIAVFEHTGDAASALVSGPVVLNEFLVALLLSFQLLAERLLIGEEEGLGLFEFVDLHPSNLYGDGVNRLVHCRQKTQFVVKVERLSFLRLRFLPVEAKCNRLDVETVIFWRS